MPSALWAGARRISAVREQDATTLQLGYAGDELGYQIDLGYPTFIERPTSFKLDPVIKSEVVFAGPTAHRHVHSCARQRWLRPAGRDLDDRRDRRRAGPGAAVDEASPGSRLSITDSDGYLNLALSQPGLLRALGAAELSDGTLRYLLWVAALLTPRPPELMVLNEPESRLHPDVLPALARLIIRASAHTQIIVVSHAPWSPNSPRSGPRPHVAVDR